MLATNSYRMGCISDCRLRLKSGQRPTTKRKKLKRRKKRKKKKILRLSLRKNFL